MDGDGHEDEAEREAGDDDGNQQGERADAEIDVGEDNGAEAEDEEAGARAGSGYRSCG